jgi:hypothetical protein
VLLAGFVATFIASFLTGPTFDEERRIAAVRRAGTLLRAVATSGPAALRSATATGSYEDLSPYGVLPGLVSAWLGDLFARLHVVDTLTGLRFGFLLVTATAPWALYAIVERARGARIALLSAAFLLAMPRWLHGAAVALEPVVVTSLWLLLLAAYFRSFPPSLAERRAGGRRRFRLAAALFGVLFGVGVAISRATLWVLPVVVIHHIVAGRGETRGRLRAGAPIPLALLLAVPIAPILLVLCEPRLWRGGAAAAAWLFASLGPTIEPLAYGGQTVTAKNVPPFYGVEWLCFTVPILVLLVSLAGAFVEIREWWRNRRAPKNVEGARGLGVLAVVVLLAVVFGHVLTPRVFVRFPPRAEALLPLIAVFAAVGVVHMATKVVGSARAPWASAGAAAVAFAAACVGLPTAGASFNLIAGGTGGAVVRRRLPVGDGSELAVLARPIDALRFGRVSVQAQEVPKTYFGLLNQVGRLKTKVDPPRGSSPGQIVIVRGDKGGAVAKVSHWGGVVWQMSKR